MNAKLTRCTILRTGFALLLFLLVTDSAGAFPSWMGVYGSVQHQANGDPGVYTVMMNQDYIGLNASVGTQINGGQWTECSMTYAGNQDGNSKWTYSPNFVYPAGAVINYYFHGYEYSSGSNIYDNNNGANYTYIAQGPSTETIGANLDILGNIITLGAGSADFSQPGMLLSYTDGFSSTVKFTSNRFYNDWVWQHGAYYGAQSGVASLMKLDSRNRLILYKPDQSYDQPVIVLDPFLGQITINGQPIGSGGGTANPSYSTLVVGSGNSATGQNSAAFGSSTSAHGYSEVVVGQYNAGGTENATQRVDTDTAFVIGNGISPYQTSNALTVQWDGTTTITGVLKAQGGILIPQQGDLSMGEFTSGTPPQ